MKKNADRMFIGFPMSQAPTAIAAFNFFFSNESFDTIIELGSGRGGLSLFLAVVAFLTDGNFRTFDIKDNPRLDSRLKSLGFKYEKLNVLNNAGINELKGTIRNGGRTLFMCDNGNKIKEVNTYSKFLKENDVIMAHDYFRRRKDHDKKLWNSCEITYDDIKKACDENGIEDFYRNHFENVFWFCGRKV